MILVMSLYELPFISYGLFSTDMQNRSFEYNSWFAEMMRTVTNGLIFTPVVLP